MLRLILSPTSVTVLGLFFVLAAHTPTRAETLVGTDVESRVIVAVKTGSEALKSRLPEGWSPIPFPRGPLTGANLLVSFIDGHVALDGEGERMSPGSRRALSLTSLAKQEDGDGVRLYLIGVFAAAHESDPYGLKTDAEISRTSSLSGPADGGRLSRETWEVATETGGKIEMSLEFTTGDRSWGTSESRVYSAGNPDFVATYRWESVTDVAMSTAIEKALDGDFDIANSIPELEPLMGAQMEVVAILAIPVRVRKTYLE